MLDISRIAPRLYQGSAPPEGHALAQNGFHVLVLAAEEIQPPASSFPGLHTVVHAGIDDSKGRELSTQEWATVLRAANVVEHNIRSGRRVLVTCQMGVNRSGLIVAVSLHRLTGLSGARCIESVRERRGQQRVPGSDYWLTPLCNRSFEKAVLAFPDKRHHVGMRHDGIQ